MGSQMAGFARGSGGGKNPAAPAIIRFSTGGSLKVEDLEEDLKIMAVLLQKSLERSVDGEQTPYRMGIPMLFQSPFVETTYLEGFGVLFEQTVHFPLLAPTLSESKPKEMVRGTDWEDARRELYGWPDNMPPSGQHIPPGLGSEYQPDQVEALKKGILETLKNAANIRELDAKDFIVVSMFGPPGFAMNRPGGSGQNDRREVLPGTASAEPFAPAGSSPNRPRALPPGEQGTARSESIPVRRLAEEVHRPRAAAGAARRDGAGQGTVLTVRVKKADIDAFGKGTISFEEFKDKATIQSYFAGSSGSTHPVPGYRAR